MSILCCDCGKFIWPNWIARIKREEKVLSKVQIFLGIKEKAPSLAVVSQVGKCICQPVKINKELKK